MDWHLPKDVDWKAIAYGIASSAFVATIAKWSGAWRRIRDLKARRRGYRNSLKDLRDAVATTTVVGRRQGFKLAEVYVDLDLAPSDLMPQADAISSRAKPEALVLLGGPGAGKSTYVKRRILLDLARHQFAFYLRLRDYTGAIPVEAAFASNLGGFRIPKAEADFDFLVLFRGVLIVLDGLDEVRVANRTRVCEQINTFYKKYFANVQAHSELIVTCRKEAYRDIPLDIPAIWEVRPLTDEQIQRFADRWPLGYPPGKSPYAFCADLQATPKILELARSPLLLVGGLMQYSESNLGIPEERFQYLARIARWLVSDWAAAQGLPPDPQRPLYDRILPRLAIEMQERSVAELRLESAVELLSQWLPQYGGIPTDASRVLDGIFTRTGILVRDVPGAVVFAQFSMQEYFAATVLARSDELQKVIDSGISPWWRETVLLAVAQIEEPTAVLAALFVSEPTIAAEAVAECPTPSLDMQEKAAAAAIACIDVGHEAAHRATVALLRKVARTVEQKLARDLEERLRGSSDVVSTVGLVLAHAGTDTATKILAAHPEAWEHCLQRAGYLSSSFEVLLVGVIEHGNWESFEKAVHLLVPRLSHDRLLQLLRIMESLEPNRARVLAGLLLREITTETPDSDEPPDLLAVASCAVRVRSLDALPSVTDDRPFFRAFDVADIAVSIASYDKIDDARRLATIISRGMRWKRDRRAILRVMASCLLLYAAVTSFLDWRVTFVAACAIALLSGPLSRVRRYYRPYSTVVTDSEAWYPGVVLGMLIAMAFLGRRSFYGTAADPVTIGVLAAFFAMDAASVSYNYMANVEFPNRVIVRIILSAYVAWLVLVTAFVTSNALDFRLFGRPIWLGLSVGVFLGAGILWVVHGADANRYRKAVEEVQEYRTQRIRAA